MFFQKNTTNNDPAVFWREYEEKCGEKILAFALGQYISGWAEYDFSFWGLLIATEGGFRVHHFPHESWIQALSRAATGGDLPKEKTIFIPKDRILSAELKMEKSLIKRILFSPSPQLHIRYRIDGMEAVLKAVTEKRAAVIVEALRSIGVPPEQTE
jgi:hypothetical protein